MFDTTTLPSPASVPAETGAVLSQLPHTRREDQLAVEQRFAVVPEWMLDSTVSDTAFRLYAVLARYGNTSGVRMPGRALLARRLHRSVDTVDRALKELTAAGILTIERRSVDGRNLTNRYHLRTHDPDSTTAGPAGGTGCDLSAGGGRSPAAIPPMNVQAEGPGTGTGGRAGAATPRRSSAARMAAALRPDPDVPTETPPPPTTPAPVTGRPTGRRGEVEQNPDTSTNRERPSGRRPVTSRLDRLGVGDLTALAGLVQSLRRDLDKPSVRWSAPCLATAIDFAVTVRGWPAQHARHALLLVAADPQTRSPMRLAEAGPWWDHAQRPGLTRTPHEQAELDGLEATLADADDRATLQRQAREHLTSEGEPVTRLSVARRACRLLEQPTSPAPPD